MNIQIDARVHGWLLSQSESDNLVGFVFEESRRAFPEISDTHTTAGRPQRTWTAADGVRNM